eukprot:396104-Alexandrium_andersonii.AAC.1
MPRLEARRNGQPVCTSTPNGYRGWCLSSGHMNKYKKSSAQAVEGPARRLHSNGLVVPAAQATDLPPQCQAGQAETLGSAVVGRRQSLSCEAAASI